MILRALLLAPAILIPGALPANDPPAAPILNLETGMHTAAIRHISVDAAGRLLLTASADKTARLWDIATGEQIRILRPPQGEDSEGKLDACALSPDGHLAALGGRTGFQWDKSGSIYLFDPANGQCLRRIQGLPTPVMQLSFSSDATRLVACLMGHQGIRVFNPADGRELARDTNYGDGSFGCDFDRAGRLATSCWDGQIRLYGPDGRLLAKARAPRGQHPMGVRFSPDGGRLAVGYEDVSHVDVLSVPDLQVPFQPEDGPGIWKMMSVAWSSDGATLFAGGGLSYQPATPVRSWAEGGHGPARDQDVGATNNIMDLAPLPKGGLLWASYRPSWGRMGADVHQPANADFFRMSPLLRTAIAFGLDRTGTRLAFRYVMEGRTFCFDLPNRRLAPGEGQDLSAPNTQSLNIRWKYTEAPTLAGKTLALWPHDRSRCLAISADQSRFVLGTEMALRCFDARGNQLWTRSQASVAEAVNLSGDGRLAIVIGQDGSIRWHRLSDGGELLALFPHADQKRWVLWTPSGYYDCSPGAEDLIGWHVNRGKDQAADFFPASRFRATFYRPDIIDRVLETLDEAGAVAAANAALRGRVASATIEQSMPPVVTILSPVFGASFNQGTLRVQASVRQPNGKAIDNVWAAVDGRRVESRGLRPQQDASGTEPAYLLDLPMPPRDCTISIIAQSGSAISEAANLRLHWAGALPAPAGETSKGFAAQPKLYVLAVGISKYQQSDLALDYPAKDARDFAAAMGRQKDRLYRDVQVKLLTDAGASRDAVLEGLEWLERQATARDVAMLFLAGHGINDPSGQYFFLPYNADPARIRSTMVPDSEFQTTLSRLPGKALLFLDSCHSGDVLKVKTRGAAESARFVNELASSENGVVVFTASTGRQASQEAPEWGNGAFTKALVEGLSGQADFQKTGRVTVNMLDLYVSERVKELTQGSQAPTTVKPGTVPDFPIAMTH
jgi:WD40 repeat protein